MEQAYDERVNSIVDQFFQQMPDQRLNYIECFRHLLERKLQKQFDEACNEIVPAGFEHLKEAAKLAAGQPNQEGAAAENGDEEEEEYSE